MIVLRGREGDEAGMDGRGAQGGTSQGEERLETGLRPRVPQSATFLFCLWRVVT